MDKDDRLSMEVWDDDGGFNWGNDLMHTYDVRVGELLESNTLSDASGDFILYMRNTWVPRSSS